MNDKHIEIFESCKPTIQNYLRYIDETVAINKKNQSVDYFGKPSELSFGMEFTPSFINTVSYRFYDRFKSENSPEDIDYNSESHDMDGVKKILIDYYTSKGLFLQFHLSEDESEKDEDFFFVTSYDMDEAERIHAKRSKSIEKMFNDNPNLENELLEHFEKSQNDNDKDNSD